MLDELGDERGGEFCGCWPVDFGILVVHAGKRDSGDAKDGCLAYGSDGGGHGDVCDADVCTSVDSGEYAVDRFGRQLCHGKSDAIHGRRVYGVQFAQTFDRFSMDLDGTGEAGGVRLAGLLAEGGDDRDAMFCVEGVYSVFQCKKPRSVVAIVVGQEDVHGSPCGR